ncbi:MAG: hypothetical protein IKH91_01595 [Prevotella sp.]|nr:hypothetical protein [Prevotella sp.]
MVINRKLNTFILFLLVLLPCVSWAQDDAFSLLGGRQQRHTSSINRKALVRRHNPTTHHVGRQQFLMGESNLFFHVDATALQTFVADPQLPLNIGLNLPDTTRLSRLDMSLDRWNGKAESRFHYAGQYYHVETVCSPIYKYEDQMVRPTYSTRITSDTVFEVVLTPAPYMERASKDVDQTAMTVTSLKHHAAVRLLNLSGDGNVFQWIAFTWRGNASLRKRGNRIVLRCKGDQVTIEGMKKKNYSLDITMYKVPSMPSDYFFNQKNIVPFTDFALRTSTGWNNFWTETGIADFSAVDSPEAFEMERKLVESLYDVAARTPADWWQQTPLTLYGFAKQVVPDMRRIIKADAEQLWRRPELIATALLTLRAYTLPEVAKRFSLTSEEVAQLKTTVLNAFCLHVAKAADLLASGTTTAPDCLDRDALLAVAKWWQEETDRVNETQRVAPNPSRGEGGLDTLPADSVSLSVQSLSVDVAPSSMQSLPTDSVLSSRLFKLPSPWEATGVFRAATGVATAPLRGANPSFAMGEQGVGISIDYLLYIAGRCWPDTWKVSTEYLLPLP